MRNLLVDVDMVVAPSDEGWIEWLQKNYGYVKCPMTNYNLGSYYKHVENPYYYWHQLDYFTMEPIKGSVEKLKHLSNYFNIVFVSAEKCGYASKNKKSWLKEYFSFLKAYVSTEEKGVMEGSGVLAIIDDRMSNLQGFAPHKRVLFETPYAQDVECSVNYTVKDWESFSVSDFCKQYI